MRVVIADDHRLMLEGIRKALEADGGFEISYKYCKGCGVCVKECPRGAMTMTREGL